MNQASSGVVLGQRQKSSANKMADTKNKSPHVLYVSSYSPRKCGIGSFARDLIDGGKQFNPQSNAQVMVMCDPLSRDLEYPSNSRFIVHEEKWDHYEQAINEINQSEDIDVVSLQHEYGIYGGEAGEYAARFIEEVKKPVVVTLHTVLREPNPIQRKITLRLVRAAAKIIVMLPGAVEMLTSNYGIPSSKVIFIPHGVPAFSRRSADIFKKELGLEDKVVMTSINLLSHHKGLDYAIESLPRIVEKIPNFMYMVIGQTHPVYLRDSGGEDVYRTKLRSLANELGVAKNVTFVNRYVSLEELVAYIGATDFYVTPYIDPQQITSGALSYAIGAGKVCISTPYVYAKEMLAEDRGVLVPFADSEKIASAVVECVQNPERKAMLERNAYDIGRSMTWKSVGRQYAKVFERAVYGHKSKYSVSA